MSTRQSEHVIYSSFVVDRQKDYYNADNEYRYVYGWYVPNGVEGLDYFDSEEKAIADAHRTFGMPGDWPMHPRKP